MNRENVPERSILFECFIAYDGCPEAGGCGVGGPGEGQGRQVCNHLKCL